MSFLLSFFKEGPKIGRLTSVNIYCEIFLRKNTSPAVFFFPRFSVSQESFKCVKESHPKNGKIKEDFLNRWPHPAPSNFFVVASLNWIFLDNDLEPGFRMCQKYSQDMKRALNSETVGSCLKVVSKLSHSWPHRRRALDHQRHSVPLHCCLWVEVAQRRSCEQTRWCYFFMGLC